MTFHVIQWCLVKWEMCYVGSQIRKWGINQTWSIFKLGPNPNMLKQDKMVQTWMNVEQKLGENVPNSHTSEILDKLSPNKRTVSNMELCFCGAFIYSSISVLEDWPWLTKSFLPVFLRLLTCRCRCNFTHLNYGNKSVGMFTVPLLMWLKAGRIRALTFHNLAKGSYESKLVSIRKNTNSLKSLLWYMQRRLWSHNTNRKSWGMPLECFGLFLFASSPKRMRKLVIYKVGCPLVFLEFCISLAHFPCDYLYQGTECILSKCL